jgi:hypothetical protein
VVEVAERVFQLGEIKCQTMKPNAAVQTIVQSLDSKAARVSPASRGKRAPRDHNKGRIPLVAVPNSIQKLDNRATRTNDTHPLKRGARRSMVGFSLL